MPAIGITGGISTAKRHFVIACARFFSANQPTRQMIDLDPDIKKEVAGEFGADIYSAGRRFEQGETIFEPAENRLHVQKAVLIGLMKDNATYPSPPVTLANVQTAKDDFTAKIAAAKAGGPADTAAKNNSRQTLVSHLQSLASYVQIQCNNDKAILLSSGFQAASTNRTQAPLETSNGLVLKNAGAVSSSRRWARSRTRACTKAASKGSPATGCRASLMATPSTLPLMG
jgi:hypothetical protein